MACYCGCDATTGNPKKWIAFSTLAVFGTFLFILGAIIFQAQNRPYTGGAGGWVQILGIVFWILSSIPLYMMCCCTEPPYRSRRSAAPQGKVIEAAPVAAPPPAPEPQQAPVQYGAPYADPVSAPPAPGSVSSASNATGSHINLSGPPPMYHNYGSGAAQPGAPMPPPPPPPQPQYR